MEREAIRQLAMQVAAVAGVKTGRKRRLTVVGAEVAPGLSAMQRDVIYSRIQDLGRMYSLVWLVRQETRHNGGIVECLSDSELEALLAKMERGREARVEGIPFDDVGLVSGALPDA